MVPAPTACPSRTEREFGGWRLLADFRARLERSAAIHPLLPTWVDPQRQLSCGDYLSVFLFGLLNPVVRTMRGLCAASRDPRWRREVCSRPVSLGSFSEAQAVVDPRLLADIFAQLSREVAAREGEGGLAGLRGGRRWMAQDGSLFAALPRMHWALWRRQNTTQAQVRLHLTLDLATATPARAVVTAGKHCERAAWRTQWRRGDAYVGDRYFGEDYRLFALMEQRGIAFVVRLRDEAVITVEEALPVGEAEARAGVLRSGWARLGCAAQYRSARVRVVWVQTPREMLALVTNLAPAELTAGEVALLYQERWRIELFFRWVKCLLGCRHWFAESPRGVAVQLYLALIAALLLQLYTGQRPNRRMMEAIQFYLLGVTTLDGLCAALEREQSRLARTKKSAA